MANLYGKSGIYDILAMIYGHRPVTASCMLPDTGSWVALNPAPRRALPCAEGYMAKRIFALDLRSDDIEWVLMRTGFRNNTVEKAGRLACHVEATDTAETVTALKALREANDTPGSLCIAAMDSRGLLARRLGVPFRDKRKVRQILPLELEATLPVPVDEVLLDFQLTGTPEAPVALTVAMPQTQVSAQLQLLRDAGLDPMLLTFAGLPAAALLAAGPHGKEASLLIDGDDRHCSILGIAAQQINFIRSWSPPALLPDPVTALKHAIHHTVEAAAQDSAAHTSFGTIYLTSPTARIFTPADLSAAVGCPVVPFDLNSSLRNPLHGAATNGLGQGALALALYEPLAEKGLNLFRSTFPLKRFLQQNRKRIIQTGALAAALTILFMLNVFLDIRRNETKANLLQSETEGLLKRTFPETRNIVDPLQQMFVKLKEARAQELTARGGPRLLQIDLLNAISVALPPTLDIHVSQLVSSTERVQLSGTAGTFEAVNEANELLAQTHLFDKITIVAATMDQKTNRVRFKMAADLSGPPAADPAQ
jgi:general secretion pathway protein L